MLSALTEDPLLQECMCEGENQIDMLVGKTKKQAGAYIFARKSIMPLLHYDNDCCGMMDSGLGWRQM